jgi:hypothetical protein
MNIGIEIACEQKIVIKFQAAEIRAYKKLNNNRVKGKNPSLNTHQKNMFDTCSLKF